MSAPTPKDALTVELALSDYRREHVEVKVVDVDRVDFAISNLIQYFGPMGIIDIDIPCCREYRRRREAGEIGRPSGSGTIRRELGVLVAAIHHEVKWKRLPKTSAPFIEKPPRPGPRERWLSKDEVSRLISAASGRTRLFIQLAYYTASRKSALFELTWFQVDMANRNINLLRDGRAQTNKKRPIVPIDDELYIPLKEAYDNRSTEWVLGNSGDVKSSFNTAAKRAGIKDVSPHVLRHTRAVHLAQDKIDLFTIAGLLGDSVATVERNYLHHCPNHIRDELQKSGGLTGA
ncbi:MAG: site-specific integrase [Sneathiella sp.]